MSGKRSDALLNGFKHHTPLDALGVELIGGGKELERSDESSSALTKDWYLHEVN